MKKIYTILTIAIVPWLAVSCGQNLPPETVGDPTAPGVKPYPLDTCLVIDRKLGSTDVTYTRVYQGQVVKFCCVHCVKAFEANPAPWIEKVKRSGKQ